MNNKKIIVVVLIGILIGSIVFGISFFLNSRKALDGQAGNVIDKNKIILLINQKRTENGLNVLVENEKLDLAISNHIADMFNQQYGYTHINPQGKRPESWIDETGYRRSGYDIGEILGEYHSGNIPVNAEEILIDTWMNSEHRKIILGSHYQEIGIAVITGVMNGRETVAIGCVFALPEVVSNVKNDIPAKDKKEESRPQAEDGWFVKLCNFIRLNRFVFLGGLLVISIVVLVGIRYRKKIGGGK